MTSGAPIVGIDLGTTYSLVAVAGWRGPGGAPGVGGLGGTGGTSGTADELAPRVIVDDEGRALCPSVVRFFEDGRVQVGHAAREGAAAAARETVSSVKRLMGRSAKDAAREGVVRTYEVVEGEGNTARVRLPWGRVVSPQEVSAHVLARLRAQASKALGVEVRRAVITVPAYFDDAQRQATRDAGALAGLEVARIVSEPTAAALAYGLGLRVDGGASAAGAGSTGSAGDGPAHVVVYDFGGGTFDVSVLRITGRGGEGGPGAISGSAEPPEFFEVLATAGDTHLGGDDLDAAVAQLLRPSIKSAGAGLSAREERLLIECAERAKIELSTRERVRVENAELGLNTELTREAFERAIMPLVERTIACCGRALRDARRALGSGSPSAVVLVGGSTRVPLVRRRVEEHFKRAPYTALDPDKVVALGAAVQGSILAGARSDALLLDVVPLSLGIETAGGAVAKVIMRNATIPAAAKEMFSTSVDGQTSIKITVVQGEREMVADCRTLGVFHLRGIPAMPAGIPQVEVELAVDANGVLSVSAVERRSGKRAAIQVVPNHGLSREEVERIEVESFKHAREDMQRHRIVDLIANGRLDLHWIERQLERAGDGLQGHERERVRVSMEALRELIQRADADWRSVDADALHAAKDALDRASVRLHEVAIARSLKGG